MSEKREKSLKFRVSDDEKILIYEQMEKLELTNFSQYSRQMLTKGKVIKKDYKELRDLISELGRIGNNINQIAKIANQTQHISENQVIRILEEEKKIQEIVRRKISKLIRD
jgi:hypothetical protein